MQRLLSSRHFHSSVVSFPSLPSLLVRSSLVVLEEDGLLVVLDEPVGVELEVLLALDFSLPDLSEVPLESEDLAGDGVD